MPNLKEGASAEAYVGQSLRQKLRPNQDSLDLCSFRCFIDTIKERADYL